MALASWCLAIPYFLYAFLFGIQLQVICASVAFCIILNYFTWCVLSMYASFMFCYCCLFPILQEMMKARATLPIANLKNQILHLLKENDVIVISGETGCGKTTQVSCSAIYKKMLRQILQIFSYCNLSNSVGSISSILYVNNRHYCIHIGLINFLPFIWRSVKCVCVYIYSLKKKPRDFIYVLIIIAMVWYTLFNYPCVTFNAECGFLMLVKSYLIWSRSTYKEN